MTIKVVAKYRIIGQDAMRGADAKYNTEYIVKLDNGLYTLADHAKRPVFDSGFKTVSAVKRHHHIREGAGYVKVR